MVVVMVFFMLVVCFGDRGLIKEDGVKVVEGFFIE